VFGAAVPRFDEPSETQESFFTFGGFRKRHLVDLGKEIKIFIYGEATVQRETCGHITDHAVERIGIASDIDACDGGGAGSGC
jgi:hypothetical protein